MVSHDDSQLAEAVCACEPWTTFTRTQPRIGRLVQDRASARQPARPPAPGRQQIRDARIGDLLEDVTAGGPARRRALEELGRRGEMLVLDVAQDPGLRNAAGWIPGMPQALHQLGPAAVPRARAWARDGRDSTLASLGTRVLAEHGDHSDIPALLSALHRDTADGDWCSAEIPAQGLGRLKAGQAAPALAAPRIAESLADGDQHPSRTLPGPRRRAAGRSHHVTDARLRRAHTPAVMYWGCSFDPAHGGA